VAWSLLCVNTYGGRRLVFFSIEIILASSVPCVEGAKTLQIIGATTAGTQIPRKGLCRRNCTCRNRGGCHLSKNFIWLLYTL